MQARKIAVLVVHGIGEQKCFDMMEEIALNFVKGLRKENRGHVQVIHGDQTPKRSEELSWRELPLRVSWKTSKNQWMEVSFREVFWADLDLEMSWKRYWRLVGWTLSMSGVRAFSPNGNPGGTEEDDPAGHGLRSPLAPGFWRRLGDRAILFLVSVAVSPILILNALQRYFLARLRINFPQIDRIIYNYLGDVMLYQDWVLREDRVECFGEKSRVAIRRRMAQALLRTAAQVENGSLDGYYILAHSLGTVVAFNGLMETGPSLPNYLTEDEWANFPQSLKSQMAPTGADQMARRPPWLSPNDGINRKQVLSKLLGFLTLGSPLDKFAALWPAIVPIHKEGTRSPIRWANIADVQDIVAGRLDLLTNPGQAPGGTNALPVEGFQLRNYEWVWGRLLFTAHTSYWKVRKNRHSLMESVVDWIENSNGPFALPPNLFSVNAARFCFGASVLLCGVLALYAGSWALWSLYRWDLWELPPFWFALWVATFSAGLVLFFSVFRRIRERWKFGPQR